MSSSPYSTIVPSDSDIEDAFSSTNILNYFPASPGNIFPNPFKKISSPKDTETSVESPISISPSSSVGFSTPVRSTTPPPSYSFNKLSNSVKISLWIILRPLGSEPVPEEPNEPDTYLNMPPKRTSTSKTPTMTQAAIRQLITDGIAAALEAQAATMANTNNTNRNTGTSRTPVARKGTNDHKRKFDDRRNTTTNTTTTTISIIVTTITSPTIATTTTIKITTTIT
ncbi:hypothetical protein Tco_1467756 [Tanacetum coccineum]